MKLDEMLSIQKSDLASENLDKGKSILGAPPRLEKKNVKNPKTKKATL